MKILQHF